jgi:hypothetical protein
VHKNKVKLKRKISIKNGEPALVQLKYVNIILRQFSKQV